MTVRPRTAASPSGPPRLSMPLWRNLGIMLVVNGIPIIGILWAFVAWDGGPHWRPGLDRHLVRVVVGVVALCVVVAVTAWVVLPLARWLRDYSRWCALHRSLWVWAVPAVAGFMTWLAVAIASWAVVLTAIVLIVRALLSIHHP